MKKQKKKRRGIKLSPQELEIWQALRKKCHTHENEDKHYTRKQKHKRRYDNAD